MGSVRAQLHLRQILVGLNMATVSQPEVIIAIAHQKFDPAGTLTDEKAKELLAGLLQRLVTLARSRA